MLLAATRNSFRTRQDVWNSCCLLHRLPTVLNSKAERYCALLISICNDSSISIILWLCRKCDSYSIYSLCLISHAINTTLKLSPEFLHFTSLILISILWWRAEYSFSEFVPHIKQITSGVIPDRFSFASFINLCYTFAPLIR